MSDFRIRANKKNFQLWEEASFSRSIDTLCGTFSFSTAESKFSDSYPVKKGDLVEIFIADQLQLTGFVDRIGGNGGIDNSIITLSGRDKTQDIVDSSAPPGVKTIEGATDLLNICDLVIEGLGLDITAYDQVGVDSFTEEEIEAAEFSCKAFDFLESLARKLQVYLISSPESDLIIYRPGEVYASTPLINQRGGEDNTVLSFEFEYNDQQRFNRYVCGSEETLSIGDYSEGLETIGEARDEVIRNSRYFEIIAEESMETEQCVNRAREESNLRRARGTRYKARVSGFTQHDGSVWAPGQIVKVLDDIADLKGFFLIRSVAFSSKINEETTDIVIAPIDAYKVSDEIDPTFLRKSSMGARFGA